MRRLLVALLVVVVIAAVVAAPRAHELLRRRLEQAIAESLEARVRIDGASGVLASLITGTVRLHGLRASRHGAWRVAVDEAVVDFAQRPLLDRRLDITRIALHAPRIAATERAAEALPSSDGGEPGPITVTLGPIVVREGRVVVAVGTAGARRLYGADRIALEVRPKLDDRRWSAVVSELALRPRGQRVPPLQAHGTIAGDAHGGFAGVDAWLDGAGHARIDGAWRTDREPTRYRVAFTTAGVSLGPLVASPPVERVRGSVVLRGGGERLAYTTRLLAEIPEVGRTRAGLAGHARGALHRMRARVTADGLRARGEGTLALDGPHLDARVQATADLAALGRRHDLALGGTTSVSATVQGPLDAVRVSATVDATTPSYGTAGVERIAAQAVIAPQADAVRVDVTRLSVVPRRGPTWTLVAPTTLATGRTISLTPATFASPEGRVVIGGRLGPDADVDVTLALEQLDLPRLCASFEVATECIGTLAARARVSGRGPAPRVEAVMRHSIGAEVVARGQVPFPWPTGGPALDTVPLALDVRSDGFEVAALQPFAGPSVMGLGGRIDVSLAVTGPVRTASVAGRLVLRDGRVEPIATRVRYQDVEAALRLESGAVVVERLAARADGTLAGSGRIELDGLVPGAVDLRLMLDRLRVLRLPVADAFASGGVDVRGTASAPVVGGTVVIGPATIRPAVLPSGEIPTAPDPTIEVVGGAAPPPPPPPSGPGLADALALDLGVRIGDDVVVRRSDARIDLGGNLEVAKAAYQPVQVRGQIRLVRGWLVFQDRRFTVEPSAIRFAGPPDQPSLELAARTRTGDYEVVVQVTGTPEKPVLSLTSEPPLEESDVLAVLLFGKPARELGQGQQVDLQRRALGLASSYVAGGLTRSLRNTLGLDVLDVALGEDRRPGEVRVGRYVTNDVLISIAQEFGTRAGQAATIEYRVRPRLSVRLSTSTSGSSGIDLFWQRRY